jgi:hypothetical protein
MHRIKLSSQHIEIQRSSLRYLSQQSSRLWRQNSLLYEISFEELYLNYYELSMLQMRSGLVGKTESWPQMLRSAPGAVMYVALIAKNIDSSHIEEGKANALHAVFGRF